MRQEITEYADPAAEEDGIPPVSPEREEASGGDPVLEALRLREETGACPVKRLQVPIVDDMDRCLRERFFPRILQEMNDRLAAGALSELLEVPVVSERILPRDLTVSGASYWRLNRSDFLADVSLAACLAVEKDGRDIPARFGFCLSLWFCTEEGFHCEFRELHRAEDRPDRSFWKLDRFLVPILRRDEIEAGADRLWSDFLPEAREPRDRLPAQLAEKMGLKVVSLRLHGQNSVRSSLLFQPQTVWVQEEMLPGDTDFPVPVPRRIDAGTILLNTACPSDDDHLDVLHECIHHEWHLLFYRLQKLMSTNPAIIRYKTVQTTSARAHGDPIRFIEQQAYLGSIALLLPKEAFCKKAWRLYQKASARPGTDGYLNHPGFRWQSVIFSLADEFNTRRTLVRRRLVQLGHPAARGAANWVEGGYITPFAFTSEASERGENTLVIDRQGLADLYQRNKAFRELMARGEFAYADGHVCLNDPQVLRTAPEGVRLTAWANAHADECCLQFQRVRLARRKYAWIPGTLNSSEEYTRDYDRFLGLSRNGILNGPQRLEERNRIMREMPNDFPDALRYLMENRKEGRVTCEELARSAQISRKTVERYRARPQLSYHPDTLVALCVGLHLPPWLSRVLLEKAGVTVRSFGPAGHLGEILDCFFMDTIPQIQDYLRSAGYPELKVQDE